MDLDVLTYQVIYFLAGASTRWILYCTLETDAPKLQLQQEFSCKYRIYISTFTLLEDLHLTTTSNHSVSNHWQGRIWNRNIAMNSRSLEPSIPPCCVSTSRSADCEANFTATIFGAKSNLLSGLLTLTLMALWGAANWSLESGPASAMLCNALNCNAMQCNVS